MHRVENPPGREALARAARAGGVAGVAGQAALLAMTLGYNAALSRVLTAEQFGVFAMGASVTAMLFVFRDAGLSTATIQRPDVTEAQVSNLFWMNVAVSGAAIAAVAVLAPAIAHFFREPALSLVAVAMSLTVLFDGVAAQHAAMLNRQMRLAPLSTVDVLATFFGMCVGVLLSLQGWGYWALVMGNVSTPALRAALVWRLSGWRPHRPRRNSGTRPLVAFGAHLTLGGVVYAITRAADQLLVGRVLGAEALGMYSRATALLTRPLERITGPVNAVMLPTLSRLQGDPSAYRRALLDVFEVMAVLGFLFVGTIAPLADPIVAVVLGPGWEGVAPLFSVLSLAAIHMPLSAAASWLYTSQGRGRDMLGICFATAAVVIPALAAASPYGVLAVASASVVANTLVLLPLTIWLAGREGPVSSAMLFRSAVRHWPVLAGTMAGTYVCRTLVGGELPAGAVLVVAGGGGLVVAAACGWGHKSTRQLLLRTRDAWRAPRQSVA